MKINFLLAFVLLSFGVKAQNLEQYIPQDARFVIEISGDKIFSLIDQSDLESMLPPDPSTGLPMDLNELGFDVNSKMYFFQKADGDVTYNNVLIKLLDEATATEMIQGMVPAETSKINGFTVASASTMTAAWNSKMAIFTQASMPKVEYTLEDIMAEKAAEESDMDVIDERSELEKLEEMKSELMLKNLMAPIKYSEEEIAAKMTSNFSSIAKTAKGKSILKNVSYKEGKNAKSSLYYWVKNFDALLSESFPSELMTMMPGASTGKPTMTTGMENITGNLIFDTEEIRMAVDMGVNDKMAGMMKKIYNTSMNKSFYNYFDTDNVLAYMNMSFDMAEMLRVYPEMTSMTYGSMLPDFKDEMDVATDLISIVLDEDAIAELVTGDMMMLLHDFEQREVTFTTTEYDDDFNATEVERTKMEPIPTFTVMVGSENTRIVNKLFKIAAKYGVSSSIGGYQKIMMPEGSVPFDMYTMQKDGIVFITNAESQAQKIAKGKKSKKLGMHKTNLENNIMNVYFNTTGIISELEPMLPADPSTIELIKNDYREVHMNMGKMKGNKFGYDMVVKTNSANGNALKQILNSMASLASMF